MTVPENFDQLPLEVKLQTVLAMPEGTETECAHLLARAIYNSTKYDFDPVTRTFSMPKGPRDQDRQDDWVRKHDADAAAIAALNTLRDEPNGRSAPKPPKIAEFCLGLFLNQRKGDALIGDLSEHFDRDFKRFGIARARRLYWGRTIRSLWPLLRRLAVRAFKLGAVVETVRRFF